MSTPLEAERCSHVVWPQCGKTTSPTARMESGLATEEGS